MKNKKNLAAAIALTLCIGSLTACTGAKSVDFSPYWSADANTKEENISQTLEYEVTFQKANPIVDYTVNYQNGKYTTELSMVMKELPQKEENAEKQPPVLVYKYVTSLSIDVVYNYKGETSETFHDVITTETYFHTTAKALKPISSKKKTVTTSPINVQNLAELKNCYKQNDYIVETTYFNDCTSGRTEIFKNENGEKKAYGSPKNFSIPEKGTYLDNEQLLFALSGITPQVNRNSDFFVYAPFTKAVQSIGVDFSNIKTDNFELIKDGVKDTYSVKYYPVTLKINEKPEGATQTAWIASNTGSAEFRNVLLKLEVPVSYNIGTLTYSLTSANFTK